MELSIHLDLQFHRLSGYAFTGSLLNSVSGKTKMLSLKEKELYSFKYFKSNELPLKVFMHEYKSSVDLWHRHNDFYELVIVCSGTAVNENRLRREPVRAGNIYLLPNGSAHRYTGINHFRHYNILFHPSLLKISQVHLDSLPGYRNLFDFQFDDQNQCSRLLSVDREALSSLVSMIETIRNETSLRLPGWKESSFFEFMRMLVYLLRCCVPQESATDESVLQIGQIIRLMEENCSRSLSLKDMAETVHMSVSSFRHHFYKITGLPPGEYLQKLRLRKAFLMLNSTSSIAVIAEQAGFPDSNYFSRQIKKCTGFTPREIQRKYILREITVNDLLEKFSPSNSSILPRSFSKS